MVDETYQVSRKDVGQAPSAHDRCTFYVIIGTLARNTMQWTNFGDNFYEIRSCTRDCIATKGRHWRRVRPEASQ